MLELLRMWNTPLLPLLPGPLWPGVVAPDKGPFYGSIELFKMELFFFYIETVYLF